MPRWSRWLVVAACAVTVLLGLYGPRTLWEVHRDSGDVFWCRNAVALIVIAGIALACAWNRFEPHLQLAVALPLLHLAAMIALWTLWTVHAPDPDSPYRHHAPVMELLSVARVLGVAAVFVVVAGLAMSRRETVHAIVMVALVTAVMVGAWLPLASRMWWVHVADYEDVACDMRLLAFVLVPPAIGGVVGAAAMFRAKTRRARRVLAGVFGSLVAIAALASVGLPDHAIVVYDNFIHVVVVLAGVAIAALALLAGSIAIGRVLARRALAGKRALAGRIAGDAGEVARVEIASWLRGPRDVVGAFTVTTRTGDVHVPGGRLLAPLAPETVQLRDGDGLVVLRGGDDVVLTGFGQEADGDHPFRSSSALIADRVIVARAGAQRDTIGTIGYALWRPSVAYLVVLLAIGVPALIAAATYTPDRPHYREF